VLGVVGLSMALSFATLAFKGDLAQSLGRGTGRMLTRLGGSHRTDQLLPCSGARSSASPGVAMAAASAGIVVRAAGTSGHLVTTVCTGLSGVPSVSGSVSANWSLMSLPGGRRVPRCDKGGVLAGVSVKCSAQPTARQRSI